MARNDEPVELTLVYLGERNGSMLFRDGDEVGDPEAWLPSSQVELVGRGSPEIDKPTTIEIPQWLAEDRGLV